ncbi:Acyl-CoA Binding Protein [Zostera marina]|uniref:Acyl-CoA Binding Protein n=1 Tax=Zostera marina TaxID=29655 RepID=A0A0K9NZD3_ZOSMR|nr:Acyl-CoA Binding Protein [Zostera marina]
MTPDLGMEREMGKSSSGISYPGRFFTAASSVGLGESAIGSISRFKNDVALMLYGLYQQATVGPCNAAKPRIWNTVELGKWTSWSGLGNMPSTEAMRLFVKLLEEEDPSWYSRVHQDNVDQSLGVEINKEEQEAKTPSENYPETKTISENGSLLETQDKDIILEGVGSVSIYDQWVPSSISGQCPKPRYQHGAAVLHDKMYIFGGNHNGRYLNDLQVLDLKSLTWSKVDAKTIGSEDPSKKTTMAPCAGHSLISWANKIISIAGHTKDLSEAIQVKEFDPQSCTWSIMKTYGKAPISRGGQSITLVGSNLVIFGGEDAKRTLLNDLHILDLESMTWDEIDAVGVSPSPRSDHSAAVHAERYLLIFGGGSHSTCFNDLHVLDLQSMEWSRPAQQGVVPSPRAGHAGITVGENWFIVGGGDNKSGASETLVLNMSTLVWSVVTSIQGRVPIASEGLSLVVSSCTGEDILVSFGGYNGRYNNEVYVLKPSHKSDVPSKMLENGASDSVAALVPETNETKDMESEVYHPDQGGRIREIAIYNTDLMPRNVGKNENNARIMEAFRVEKEELEVALSKERLESLRLKQELSDGDTRKADLTKELQSVRGQLASEQSRCFKLEVDVAELRQKLHTMEALQKEVELLQRQKAAAEQDNLSAAKQRQSSGGVWGWLAGSPPDEN